MRTFIVSFILLSSTFARAQDCRKAAMDALASTASSIYHDLTKDTSPFNYACQDPQSFARRPATPWYSRVIPEKDSAGHTSVEFLKLVTAKIHEKIRENRTMMENLRGCMKSSNPGCDDAKTWVQKTLPDYVKDTRFELSLAQSPYQVKSWIGSSDTAANSALSDLGSPKMTAWDPLTSQERRTADRSLKYYRDKIYEQIDKKRGHPSTRADIGHDAREIMKGLMTKRYEHFQNYQAHMANVPLLQYLHSESPSVGEVLEASERLTQNLGTEAARLAEMEAPLRSGRVTSSALGLLEYSTLVEETLLEHPEFCGIAVSLQKASSHRGVQNAAAIALPILAVSIFAAPVAVAAGASAAVGTAAATALGAGASLGFLAQSQGELDRERTRDFSQLYGNIDDLNRVARLTRSRNYQVYTLPVAFAGTGTLASSFNATGKFVGAVKTLSRVGP